MNYRVCTAGAVAASLAGTYDFGSSIAQVKAIDQAMRNYFGTDHWLLSLEPRVKPAQPERCRRE
jgi:hypothetical protein